MKNKKQQKKPNLCYACAVGQRWVCLGKGCDNEMQSNFKAFRHGRGRWDHIHEAGMPSGPKKLLPKTPQRVHSRKLRKNK